MPYDIFINYRRDDTLAMAVVLEKFLKEEFDNLEVFLDLEGIEGGMEWPEKLRSALAESRVVLTLVGDKFLILQDRVSGRRRLDMKNDWVRIEIEKAVELAKDNKIELLPLLVDGAFMPEPGCFDEGSALQTWTKRQGTPIAFKNFDSDFRKLVALLEKKVPKTRKNKDATAKIDPLSIYPLPEINPFLPDEEDLALAARNPAHKIPAATPYLGLRYFRRKDAPLFFGRSLEIIRFFELLDNADVRIIRLYGPSGVGKSSLLAAGLLPRLEKQHVMPFYRRRNKVVGLHRQLEELAHTNPDSGRRVYILDQAEEMFTDPLRDEKEAFTEEISRVLKADPKATLVLGFRSDYLVEMKGLLRQVRFRKEDVILDALSYDALIEAVEGVHKNPVLKDDFDLQLEPGFADFVARDLLRAESGSATSILQNRLLKLYEEGAAKRAKNAVPIVLSIEAYQTLTQSNTAEEELLDYQLQRLRSEHPLDAPAEKQVLDLLHKFVLDKPTAGTVPKSDIAEEETSLYESLRRVNLLAEIREPAEALRLSHDLLAPVVRRRYDALVKANTERLQIENFDLLLDRIQLNLPELKFEEAAADLRQSMALGIHPERLAPIAFELAYVFLKAGKAGLSAELCAKYAQLQRDCKALKPPMPHDNLPDWLRQCEPNHYLELEARYFPEMRPIPGGSFDMGDVLGDGEYPEEEKVHRVTLDTFRMAATPVTWRQYGLYCFAAGMQYPNDGGWGRGNRPVVHVNWYDAVSYAIWLNEQYGILPWYSLDKEHQDPNNHSDRDKLKWTATLLPDGRGFRLPTEAEWEYAAREAGKPVRFGNGAMIANPAAMNFDASEGQKKPYSITGDYRGRTTPVHQFKPNALGLYDISGNVWEWCQDWYGDYPESSAPGYAGPVEGSYRVLRGWSWIYFPVFCRVASRRGYDPENRYDIVGFRLVFVP